jgi:hypothetical protein
MKLYVWRNSWFYNGTGIIMGIGNNMEEALNEAINYIVGIEFAGLSRLTVEKMVREKTQNIIPDIYDNEAISFILL